MRPQASGFEWIDTAGGPALVSAALAARARHFFTTRGWRLGAADGNSADGWAQVAAAMNVLPDRLARVRQVHGADVVIRRQGEPFDPAAMPDADVIATDDPSLAIAIQTADCVPLLIADLNSVVVAAAHAGWRGLAAGVPMIAVAALKNEFGVDPKNLIVAIGPSISAARYEVGEDVRAAFQQSSARRDHIDRWFGSQPRPGHWRFDGWTAARDQLVDAGVARDRIHGCELCTATYPEWFCSYRRDGRPAGRMAAAIRLLT